MDWRHTAAHTAECVCASVCGILSFWGQKLIELHMLKVEVELAFVSSECSHIKSPADLSGGDKVSPLHPHSAKPKFTLFNFDSKHSTTLANLLFVVFDCDGEGDAGTRNYFGCFHVP